jgi:hypothetical protein
MAQLYTAGLFNHTIHESCYRCTKYYIIQEKSIPVIKNTVGNKMIFIFNEIQIYAFKLIKIYM